MINTYLSYAVAMLMIFGIAFELPLVFVLLNLAGVLTHQRFRKWRRMIIFLVFAFAAVFTPSPDPLSMLLLAIPCLVLVEASEVFCWANDRRRARQGSLSTRASAPRKSPSTAWTSRSPRMPGTPPAHRAASSAGVLPVRLAATSAAAVGIMYRAVRLMLAL